MSNERQATQAENIGCLAIIGLIVFVAVMPMIIEFIKFLLVVGFIVGIGYVVYKILNDEVWADRAERLLGFSFNQLEKDEKEEASEYEIAALQSPKIDELTEEINRVKNQILDLSSENDRLRSREKVVIKETLDSYAEEVKKQKEEQVLHNIFGDVSVENYDRSTEYEKQEHEKKLQQDRDEIDIMKTELTWDKKFLDLSLSVHDRTLQTEEKVNALKQVVMDGFTAVAREFLGIQSEITSLKGYVVEKFTHLEMAFTRELANVREMVVGLEHRVHSEISDVKVQFGREVVRLDQQQLQMVGQLQNFSTRVESFANDIRKVKLDAERFSWNGEQMLQKANLVQQQHKANMTVMANNLQVGLQKMAIHDQDFSNRVGRASLLLEQKSNDILFSLKDMSYEKIGIGMLRQDFQQREVLQNEKLNRKKLEISTIKNEIKTAIQHNQNVSSLQHSLNMANQQKSHISNVASMMQREHSLMRRLSN